MLTDFDLAQLDAPELKRLAESGDEIHRQYHRRGDALSAQLGWSVSWCASQEAHARRHGLGRGAVRLAVPMFEDLPPEESAVLRLELASVVAGIRDYAAERRYTGVAEAWNGVAMALSSIDAGRELAALDLALGGVEAGAGDG